MLKNQRIKKDRQNRRIARSRAKIFGTSARPRLAIFRSLKHISAQLIDDEKSQTLVSVHDREVSATKNKTDKAVLVGELIAKKATDKKIMTCVFDRRGYKYHGRVKALADKARETGLQF